MFLNCKGTRLTMFRRGNLLVTSGTTLCTIALTWGGIAAPWDSAQVLVTLILGLVLLGLWLVWDAIWAKVPLVRLPSPRLR